jgi:RecB family endonuclease NucS
MAKKEEMLKVTEDELKSLQEIVGSMNGATTRVGQIENQKHMVLHDLSLMRTDLMKLQGELEATYGKVDVNIQDGTINVREDVEADTKD